jgi:hypothetical protein
MPNLFDLIPSLLQHFPEVKLFMEQDKKYSYNNIYTDLLRHNFIYGESKCLSKFILSTVGSMTL